MPTINKVIVDGEEIINLDNDTLSDASQIASGITAHLNTGEQVVGTGELALYDYPIGGSYCDYVDETTTGSCTGFHISETATQIRPNAFLNRKNLQSVYIPTSVASIGESAFKNCTSLTSIDVSNATSIGTNAFYNCTSLQSIDVSNATTIGWGVFYNCTSLQSIDVSNATTIGHQTFQNCTSLQSIDVSNATTIGWGVFYNCTNLTSITIKNGVVYEPKAEGPYKIATFNGHLYWQNGATPNKIYISDAVAGTPTRTQIGTLTTDNPSFTYTDGPYTITFARTGESYNKFSISW